MAISTESPIILNFKPILTNNRKSQWLGTPSHTGKTLFYKLFLARACSVVLGVSLAFSAVTPAYAFSFSSVADFFGFTRDDVSVLNAEANSQTASISLLSAVVGPEMATNTEDVETSIIGDSAMLADSGPMGSLADIQELSKTTDRISAYTIRKGDTISKVAKMFDVSVNTILWANDMTSGQTVREGDVLVILPTSGVQHKIVKGDNLSSIAKKYGGSVENILRYNNIDINTKLAIGDVIIIPDGVVRVSSPVPTSKLRGATGLPTYAGYYIRPIVNGRKTQGLHGNNGVDFAPYCHCSGQEPILASAGGTVIIAKSSGWNGGYGKYVVITHPNGTQTLYAHMSLVLVNSGDSVKSGQVIGLVGNTGLSTGPHVHFEIRGARNPF